jgi:hypothetical protein
MTSIDELEYRQSRGLERRTIRYICFFLYTVRILKNIHSFFEAQCVPHNLSLGDRVYEAFAMRELF